MPRLRIVIAFLAGIGTWMLVGLLPSEWIGWLREWSGRPGPDPDDQSSVGGKRRRARRKGS